MDRVCIFQCPCNCQKTLWEQEGYKPENDYANSTRDHYYFTKSVFFSIFIIISWLTDNFLLTMKVQNPCQFISLLSRKFQVVLWVPSSSRHLLAGAHWSCHPDHPHFSSCLCHHHPLGSWFWRNMSLWLTGQRMIGLKCRLCNKFYHPIQPGWVNTFLQITNCIFSEFEKCAGKCK